MIDGLFGGFESWTDTGGAVAANNTRSTRTYHQMTARGFRVFWPLLLLLLRG
jgi:hypothetical protein